MLLPQEIGLKWKPEYKASLRVIGQKDPEIHKTTQAIGSP